ncbi:hypothetical protein H6G51_03490 [Limnothrix sp. FACHB-708]|nr:hypothetical protein [Limnothrix sp. FACHB-708]MBD2590202.1 hypothetical protein [Limnothrix sp. FACHB-406]
MPLNLFRYLFRSPVALRSVGLTLAVTLLSPIAQSIYQPARADGNHHHHQSSPPASPSASPHSPHNGSGHGGEHQHGRFDIPAGQPIPTVSLSVLPDPKQGWNLQLTVQNFQFAPEQINQPGAWNQGHAHLYLNGRKLTRLYSNWYYLESLPSGSNQIQVTLNTNDHKDLYANGQRVEAQTVVQVP